MVGARQDNMSGGLTAKLCAAAWLAGQQKGAKDIAQIMNIKTDTVKSYLESVVSIMHLSDSKELKLAIQASFVAEQRLAATAPEKAQKLRDAFNLVMTGMQITPAAENAGIQSSDLMMLLGQIYKELKIKSTVQATALDQLRRFTQVCSSIKAMVPQEYLNDASLTATQG